MKLFKVLFICLILSIISCTNEPSDHNLTIQDFEVIGEDHNMALREILPKININNSYEEKYTFIHEELDRLFPLAMEYSEEAQIDLKAIHKKLQVGSSEYYNSVVEESSISNNLRTGLLEIKSIINEGNNVTKINSDIDQLSLDMINNLKKNEIIIFLSTASVAKYSAKFWLPEYLEGENGLSLIHKNPINKFSWGGLILSDAAGVIAAAASSLVSSGGLSAAPNPALGGIPTAGAIGLIGGASASINYAIE